MGEQMENFWYDGSLMTLWFIRLGERDGTGIDHANAFCCNWLNCIDWLYIATPLMLYNCINKIPRRGTSN